MSDLDKLEIKASITVQKPIGVVFESIVDPAHMSGYFIEEGSGRLETGKTLEWKFPEMEEKFSIQVKETEVPAYLAYSWQDFDGTETLVEMRLLEIREGATKVTVTEKSRDNDAAGLGWYGRNTGGWHSFLAFLKAYCEYGINLRKGAYEAVEIPGQE